MPSDGTPYCSINAARGVAPKSGNWGTREYRVSTAAAQPLDVCRAPSTTTFGWNAAAIGGTKIPTMIIAGALDKQVTPDRVKIAYDDLGATDKVLVDLGCSSHNAMWEKNHLLMFGASLEWLTKGAVGEQKTGVIRLGY